MSESSDNMEIRPTLEGIKVLLVEDNFFNQMFVSKMLENWKCSVEIAGNGKNAIEKIEEVSFDIILMDLQMPEMDGYEATSYIRSHFPAPQCDTPIIAMSANTFESEIANCLGLGMNDYISKPFDENNLYEKICKALGAKIQK